MIYAWLVAFLVGCLLGELFVLPQFSVFFVYGLYLFILLLCIYGLRRRLWSRARGMLIIGLGFFWGVVHNPPYAVQPGAYRVSSARIWCRLQPLLVEDANGIYRAFGRGQVSDWGKVTVRPKAQALLQEGVWFESQKPLQATWLERKMRQHLDRLSSHQTSSAKMWFDALFLGEASSLDPKLTRSFKVLGLFHLLVISGAHIALFAKIASVSILIPLQFIYGLRWIRPHRWVQVFPVLKLLALVIILAFSIASGMSAATQRSLLIYAVLSFTNIFSFGFTASQRICLAAVLQAFLFPIGFLSSANLMSWMAYLFVFQEYVKNRVKKLNIWQRISQLFWLQCKLSICAAMAFGNLSVIGIFCNLAIVPCFGIFYVWLLIIVFMFFWIPSLVSIAIEVLNWIEFIIIDLSDHLRTHSWAYVDLADFHWIWRWSSCLASAILLCELLSNYQKQAREAN